MAHKVYGGEDCYVACDAPDVLHTLEAHYAPEKRACEWLRGLRLWASIVAWRRPTRNGSAWSLIRGARARRHGSSRRADAIVWR